MAAYVGPWSGRTCLIVGGSRGIGFAMAKLLAAAGAHVYLAARDAQRLQEALTVVQASTRDPSQRTGVFSLDVTRSQDVNGMLAALRSDIAPPDVVINSAGIVHPGRFEDLDLDVFRTTLDLNVMGTVNVTKAVLPEMLARRAGHIINISSVAGFLSVFGYTAYSASKFAVRGFTDALRAEVKPYGIRVSLALPPDTETPGLDHERTLRPPELSAIAGLSKALPADQVAASLLKQAAKGRYLLLPGLGARAMWLATHALAGAIYPIMDYLVASAQKRAGLQK